MDYKGFSELCRRYVVDNESVSATGCQEAQEHGGNTPFVSYYGQRNRHSFPRQIE